tara:strand:+ start:661 stop:867 length:207 start_codon:yes stop_codon:yes gene_type:complete
MVGVMMVVMEHQEINLVVEAVVLVVLVIQVLRVELVFNFQPHLEIQMDSNMITTQTTHLDLVQLLVGL